VSLQERLKQINTLNPDLLISLHAESNDDPSVNGFSFFMIPKNKSIDKSTFYASHMERFISKDFVSNGVKSANFFILKNANAPATLIQLGYLSNEKDKALLTTAEGQSKIAKAICQTLK